MAFEQLDDLIDHARDHRPVVPRSPVERWDCPSDPDGGHFLFGAQLGWSREREGFRAGSVQVQAPDSCQECGGFRVASDRATGRLTTILGVDAGSGVARIPGRRLGPHDVCAGCLRTGPELSARVEAATVATAAREAHEAGAGHPYAGLHTADKV